jgi:hypothetical protein
MWNAFQPVWNFVSGNVDRKVEDNMASIVQNQAKVHQLQLENYGYQRDFYEQTKVIHSQVKQVTHQTVATSQKTQEATLMFNELARQLGQEEKEVPGIYDPGEIPTPPPPPQPPPPPPPPPNGKGGGNGARTTNITYVYDYGTEDDTVPDQGVIQPQIHYIQSEAQKQPSGTGFSSLMPLLMMILMMSRFQSQAVPESGRAPQGYY